MVPLRASVLVVADLSTKGMKSIGSSLLIVVLMLSALLASLTISIQTARASMPAEPHDSNAMWIEPSTLVLNATVLSRGYRFNVTVWINSSVQTSAWQFELIYNKERLNASRVGYTGDDKSQFFQNITTLSPDPLFGAHNGTHDYVMHGEAWLAGPYRSPGYGSLDWIEFEVIEVPFDSVNVTLDIATSSNTFVLDSSFQRVELDIYNALVELVPSAYVGNEVIVGFYGPMALFQGVAYSIATKYGIALNDTNTELSAALFTDVNDTVLSMLRDDPDVKYAERNYVAKLSLTPNDPSWSLQWGPVKMEAPQAWDIVTGSSTFRVAVVDTGIDYNHPDLSGNYQSGGYDWVDDDSDPLDDHGHGTHVAGIIGAVGNNGIGIAGMAWNIKIIAEKVAGPEIWASYWRVGRAIVHAVLQEAKIINLSLGGDHNSTYLHQSVRFAYNHGRLLVAASGNDGGHIDYPAKYPEVVAVGSIDRYDTLAPMSNRGSEQELVAPGEGIQAWPEIYSTMPTYHVRLNDPEYGKALNYDYLEGTSMASAHATGVAALTWITNPDLGRDELRSLLDNTALDLGDEGHDAYYGYGKARAHQSVSKAQFRHSLTVSPTSQTIVPGGSVVYTVSVSLVQGPTQTVSLSLDPMYPLNPDLTASFAPSSGSPPFIATLTLTASPTAGFSTEILRIRSVYTVAGTQISRYSNFFSISMTAPPAGDLVWIKTSPRDNGAVPRSDQRLFLSPDIWSSPSTPKLGETNTLYVKVRNKGTVDTGQVFVQVWFTDWSPFNNITQLPSLGPKTISNIPAGGSVIVDFSWFLPITFSEHICIFAQAWRPGLEPFSNQFGLRNNNNIAQKNFFSVASSSPYTTTLNIRNPTNQTVSLTLYLESPDPDWIVDFCMPSTWDGVGPVRTPLTIPPRENIKLNLTIFRPEWADRGLINVSASIEGYENLYPDLSGATFEVTKGAHDVAILNVTASKTVVGQGYSMSVNVTVENQGNFTETIDVAANYNGSAMALPDGKNHTTINLPGGNYTTVTFTWNTTGTAKGNYILSAYATPVSGETDTADNNLTDGQVVVAMIGDIIGPEDPPGSGQHPPDGKVDIRDIAAIALLFGVEHPDPRYNANYDLTGPTRGMADGKIDIRDIAAAATRFGLIDP